MYIHTGERLGQPQKPLISEYIKWVQRSLNLRGECMQADGLDSSHTALQSNVFKKKWECRIMGKSMPALRKL